jgi:putative nucleotidyltransferase with HDIG domain
MGKKEALQTFGDRINLPSLPDVVLRISSMIDDPAVGLGEMGRLVAQDPAITARVLRLANSGYYGLREQVTHPEQAATVIGARALRNVAMQVSVLQRYEHLRSIPDFDLDELWAHSLLTARLSQAIAELCYARTGVAPEDFYACGLLHDIGKVVMLEGLDDAYVECLRYARLTGTSWHQAEERILGFTHIEVGSLLAQQWQLPDKVVFAIDYHHGPTNAIVAHPHVGVIAIADQLAYRASSASLDASVDRLTGVAERILGIPPARFARIVELARVADREARAQLGGV